MTHDQHLEQVMALAGVHQAAFLVQQIARHGTLEDDAFQSSIGTLFKINADTTESVYGGWSQLRPGLKALTNQLNRRDRDLELTRYTVCLLFLERKLTRRHDLMQLIVDGVTSASAQVDYFSLTHSNVLANLADLYSRTISTLSPRIMVTGTQAHLNHGDNANKIRSLLLAGMRSTVLWRQLGGSRLQLLLGRKHIVRSAQELLQNLEA